MMRSTARDTDNRNMNDMETMYVARIEVLVKALADANDRNARLREDLDFAERMLTRKVVA